MYNSNKDTIFYHLISGLDKSMQATLNIMYAKSKMEDEEKHRREMEQMKQEIAEYVIAHITATVDISEILMEIDALRKAIENLGK